MLAYPMNSLLSDTQIACFEDDGFVPAKRIIAPGRARAAADRYERLFAGDFETGLNPDEWNWREDRDPADHTRQICNGWKSDYTIARIVLCQAIGRTCARLGGWPGARLYQDNVIWKPPGAKALGFHQDNSYLDFIVPGEMVTCWVALDETTAEGGTIDYARGSHRWGASPPIGRFHAPDDPLVELREAARKAGAEVDLRPIVALPGGGSFHHGWTWHGSGVNRGTAPRRSLVVHCISSEARFHETNKGYIYGRYKRFGDTTMDESFFPMLWTQDGDRSSFLDDYLSEGKI